MKIKNGEKMSETDMCRGAYVLWKWHDREIDDLRKLRKELLDFYSKGFSGVIAKLDGSRYEFINPKVIRSIAQTSHWAKKRSLSFWFQIDPRQASRSLINKTGERVQNLIVTTRPGATLRTENLGMARVVENRFEIKYRYPRLYPTSVIQERAVCFEPAGVERVFLFKMEEGKVLRESVKDITSQSEFFADVKRGRVEIFGDLDFPCGRDSLVLAFPCFDTNLYDYAGRESNDYLNIFIENLFDACTHLDGITWGNGETGYIAETGHFPVSLSLYNSFMAEYGYDVRNFLYALVLDVDDGSHITIRNNYYDLLMDMVFSAQKDFYEMIHSFFNDLNVGFHHSWYINSRSTAGLLHGDIDPWLSLPTTSSIFMEIGSNCDSKKNYSSILSGIIIAKSLGRYSKDSVSFFTLNFDSVSEQSAAYWLNIVALYSLEPLIGSNEILKMDVDAINRRVNNIRALTGLEFPESDVALIFPAETVKSVSPLKAEQIIMRTNSLIADLTLHGIQLDVIDSALFMKGRQKKSGIEIDGNLYKAIVYPFPEVVDSRVLERICSIKTSGFPLYLGGGSPKFTQEGKQIGYDLKSVFDPDDIDTLLNKKIIPLFHYPENALATLIRGKDELIFLLCPREIGGVVNGEVIYGNYKFYVPESRGLVIFKTQNGNEVIQIDLS